MNNASPAISDVQTRVWRLDRGDTTALWVAASGRSPRLMHYGAALPQGDESSALLATSSPGWPHGTLDQPVHAGVFPQASSGFGGHPALLVHRDGVALEQPMALLAVEVCGDFELCFCFAHDTLRFEQRLRLTQSGVLVAQSSVQNLGDAELQVDWLAAGSLELAAMPLDLESYHGRWGQEFQARRKALDEVSTVLENRRGRSSHQLFPGLVIGVPGFVPARGHCHALQLAWSGNFRLIAQRQFDGSALLQAGVLYQPGEARLAPGEQMRSPELLCSHGQGADACGWRFHDYARTQVLPAWTREPRPVHSNSWEACYFDLDTDKLCALVDAAAAIGAERFVLDDGWFQGRRDDTAGLGDWWVDKTVFPDGLQPLVDHVHAAGLQFGLWFEPEMVNPDSILYREHPEWVLSHSGVDMPSARQQRALDIARPEVADYLFERMAALVEQYSVAYIKWDMNRDLPAAGDAQVARAAAQPPALYALMARLRARFPALEIESCSSGGARCDLGVLAETGRVWVSDNIDPVDRFRIHQAAAQFLAPEILGAHMGPATAHLTGRVTSVHTRAVLAMTGQFGFELDPRGQGPDEIEQLRAFSDLYKQHRQWLSKARLHRLSDCWPGLAASVFVAEDRSIAMLALLAERSLDGATGGRVTLPGLHAETVYQVTVGIADTDELQRRNRQMPAWMATGVRMSGALLAATGLPLPVLSAHAGLLIFCERER